MARKLFNRNSALLAAAFLAAAVQTGALAQTQPAQPARPGQPVAPRTAPNYRLQPGDELTISVLPRVEYSSVETIPPDGLIHLKNLGGVKAAGMTVDELTAAAVKEFERILKRPRVTIAITRLGQPLAVPQVTVSGAVAKPGPVNLEEGLRVRKAIELSGGTMKDADLKRVIVVHRDLSRVVVDLSNEEKVTDPLQNRMLLDGDSIEVPSLVKLKITVTGGVSKPGPLEEVDGGARVRKAIELAGGTVKDADLSKVVVTHPDQTRTIIDLSKDEQVANATHNLELQDGDSVEVPLLYKQGAVAISGEVAKPGSYELLPGLALDGLIVTAEKLTMLADYEHIELQRRGETKQTINLLERLKQGISGKVVLEPGDQVFVPRRDNMVMVIGAIPNPGPRGLVPGQTLRRFFTEGQADQLVPLDESKISFSSVQLIRAGETQKIDLRSLLKGRKKEQDVALQNGDVIYLPARLESNRNPTDLLRVLPFIGSFLNFL